MIEKRSRAQRTRADVAVAVFDSWLMVLPVKVEPPYGSPSALGIAILCVNQLAAICAAAAITKRDPSATDRVVAGAKHRASNTITAPGAGSALAPATRRRSAPSRSTSERGSSASS